MQTFLPLPDFQEALRTLDPTRLGNQVYREGFTLLRGGWPNHPASKMWRGYEVALAHYIWVGLDVLAERGKFYDHHRFELEPYLKRKKITLPPWIGDPAFHASHRSNLLRKDPLWYSQFGWTEPEDLPYIWPLPKVK